MSTNLDETVRLYSEKREEWIREVREERQDGAVGGQSCTFSQANLSAKLLPGRNEWPGNLGNRKNCSH